MDKIFFHIDVNSAFLSWTAVDELRRGNTVDLRTVPAIIGGDRDKRHGIVLARSIPAKAYGIVTAEPVANAIRKCPNLLIASPDFKVYSSMSHSLMDYLKSLTPDIEQASIDECYMDFTPIAYLYDSPVAAADMIRSEVYKRFGFTVNVGISDRKVLAKMASDFTKPDRTHTLFASEIKSKMWPLPVGDLFLCGKSARETLRKLGINTIGDLAQADLDILCSHLKSHGKTLYDFANGIDDSGIITEPPEAKGIGNSTTPASDITDRNEASKVLFALCESVSARLHKGDVLAKQVTVEIKYATFKSVSRQTGLDNPIKSSEALHAVALSLFDSLWTGEPIRLLGVRVSKLVGSDEPVQLTLFSEGLIAPSDTAAAEAAQSAPIDDTRSLRLDEAVRSIRDRFGKNAIKRGTDSYDL